MDKDNSVTIYSDASHFNKRAGSGYVVVSRAGKLKGHFTFKAQTVDVAEVIGCLAALSVAVDNGVINGVTQVTVMCDSMVALAALRDYLYFDVAEGSTLHDFHSCPVRYEDIFNQFSASITLPEGVKFYVKHIKGHTGQSDWSAIHQRQTHKLAKHGLSLHKK